MSAGLAASARMSVPPGDGWHCRVLGSCCHSWLLLLLLAGVHRAAGICEGAEDDGKVVITSVTIDAKDRGNLEVEIFCGDDSAKALGRAGTKRRSRTTDGKALHRAVKKLDGVLKSQFPAYSPPDRLDARSTGERARILKTAGQQSRRAVEHANKKDFAEAVADVLRALDMDRLDSRAKDKLSSVLDDILKKNDKTFEALTQDGDLSELYEALELDEELEKDIEVPMKTLKNKYRELSVKYHPDKNPEMGARFNKIRDAYEILSDPVKTLLFDTGGMETVKKYEKGDGELERGENMDHKIELTLEDLYNGIERTVSKTRRVICRSCRLYPTSQRCTRCNQCPSTTEMRQRWFDANHYGMEEHTVRSKEKCKRTSTTVTIQVEKGTMAGETINHRGMADESPKKITGDLQVQIEMRPHKYFQRLGNDLLVHVPVSLHEALLGFEREIKHMDGHILRFSVGSGDVLRPGFVVTIHDEGMPIKEDSSSYGKLICKFDIEFPEEIPESARDDLDAALRKIGQKPKTARVDPAAAASAAARMKKRSEL